MINILFVCLGNICRSPAAEGVMKALLEKEGLSNEFYIESAGIIDYHEGELPDARMRRSASARGYVLDSRSRPVAKNDFMRFDYLIGMDNHNIKALKQMATSEDEKQKIYLMSDFLTKYNYNQIPDPYYGDGDGFELVLDLLEDATEEFLRKLKEGGDYDDL